MKFCPCNQTFLATCFELIKVNILSSSNWTYQTFCCTCYHANLYTVFNHAIKYHGNNLSLITFYSETSKLIIFTFNIASPTSSFLLHPQNSTVNISEMIAVLWSALTDWPTNTIGMVTPFEEHVLINWLAFLNFCLEKNALCHGTSQQTT